MIKVLIVDDEVRICHLLEKLIDWQSLNMRVVGIANDGISAYEQILQKLPDIVITDIRMSGYDGIELIRKTKEAGIPARFVIVSGYRQFEYAKNAIRYGAVGYILKPINKDELTGILQNLSKQLELERDLVCKEEELLKNVESSKNMMRRQLAVNLMMGRHFTPEDISQQFGLELAGRYIRFFVIKVANAIKESDAAVKILLDKKISASLEKELQTLKVEAITFADQELIVCAPIYEPEQGAQINEWAGRLCERLKTLLGEFEEYRLSIGLGRAVNDLTELTDAMQTALLALRMRFILGTDVLIVQENIPSGTARLSEFLTAEYRERLEKSIEAFNASAFSLVCTELFGEIRESGPENVDLLFELENEVLRIIQSIYGMQDCDTVNRLSSFVAAFDYQEFIALFLSLTCEIIDQCHEKRRQQDEQPIRIAKKFIEAHYSQQITLEEVASVVNLSPTYFSIVFKKFTDKNFSEYIIDRRIKEAKRLLRETTCNINEIAGMVGYRDSKYFSKLFAKVTGLKPNEFRRLYS